MTPEREGVLIAYVTCGTAEEAARIARDVVERRLAACANHHPHHAVYRWNEAVEEACEHALLLKTTRAAWPALMARVQELHSYDTPCVVALPIEGGSAQYLEWIRQSVTVPYVSRGD